MDDRTYGERIGEQLARMPPRSFGVHRGETTRVPKEIPIGK